MNKELDQAQGMSFGRSVSINRSMMLEFIVCLTANGVAGVETRFMAFSGLEKLRRIRSTL